MSRFPLWRVAIVIREFPCHLKKNADNKNVKRIFFSASFALAVSIFPLFSQQSSSQETSVVSVSDENRCPALLAGLWRGSDRYIYFDGGENAEDSRYPLSIVLKEYYGWYYDRAAEPASESEKNPRAKNAAQSTAAEQIFVTYENLLDTDYENCGAWDLIVKYPHEKQSVHIPVAVIEGRLYLDFALHDSADDFYGLYKRTGNVKGITISVPKREKELDCLYFVEGEIPEVAETEKKPRSRKQIPYVPVSNRMLAFYGATGAGSDEEPAKKSDVTPLFAYHLRYWRTDMEYQPDALVSFTPLSGKTYEIKKHLIAGDELYTSATGRRKEVRNMNKAEPELITNYELGIRDDGRVLLAAFGEPYLVREDGELSEIIAQANSRRKPPAKPLFEDSKLDFHIEIIDILERYNPTIQEFKEKGGRSYLNAQKTN